MSDVTASLWAVRQDYRGPVPAPGSLERALTGASARDAPRSLIIQISQGGFASKLWFRNTSASQRNTYLRLRGDRGRAVHVQSLPMSVIISDGELETEAVLDTARPGAPWSVDSAPDLQEMEEVLLRVTQCAMRAMCLHFALLRARRRTR